MLGLSILPCLLLAGLLGAWIGWLLKGLLSAGRDQEYQGKIVELENSWSSKLKAKTGEFDALQANFHSQSARLSALDGNLATASASLADRDAALADWEAKYNQLAASSTAENSKDDAELADLKAKLAQANADLEAKAKAAASAEAELNAQLGKVKADLEVQAKAAETSKNELATLQQNAAGKDSEIAKLMAGAALAATLQGKLSDWESKYNTDIANRDEELVKLRASLAEGEARYKQLEAASNAENSKDDGEIAALKAQLAKAQADLETQTKAAGNSAAELNVLRQDLAGKDAEITKLMASTALVTSLQGQVGDWENKYKTDLANRDSEIGSLRAKITDLEMLTNAPKQPDWTDLILIEGIGDTYYKKLSDVGISWQKELLKRGADKDGRKEIAEKSGIREDLILTWVNHCDLRRVNGVSEQYAELLERAGVDTVVELATRRPENLFNKLVEVNNEKHVAPSTPIAEEVVAWVAQAKHLGRVVTH